MDIYVENEETIMPLVRKFVPEIKSYFKAHGRNETIKMIHDLISNQYESEKGLEGVTCSKGCSFCCHDIIYIHPSETDYIKDKCKQYGIKPDRKISKAFNSRKIQDLKWEHKRCPFLSDKGECRIYSFRPMVCRSHNSREDPKLCFNPDNNISHEQVYALEATALAMALFMASGIVNIKDMDILNAIKF
jgi:Fe-S-cluster containining protein